MISKEKIEQLKRDAEAGDASAQNTLACAYYNGDGIEKDIPAALELFRKSAAGGDNYGLSNLAYRYKYGKDGCPKDEKKAFELYLQAAKQGHASAQECVGLAYDFGHGVDKNYEKAVEWYRKAAAKSLKIAQNNLGSKYENGQGVERNYHLAFEWYMKAALQDEEYAMCNVGILFEDGKGVPVNYKAAIYWYKKSANKGHERAIKRLKWLKAKYDESLDEPCLKFPCLAENPFRLLGVFTNSTIREISANKSKMAAFLKIGKAIELPVDKLSKFYYSPVYPIQTYAFPMPINESIDELYSKVLEIGKQLESEKNRTYYSDYDENDEEQVRYHNDAVNNVNSLKERLCIYQSNYETKRKELFTIHRSEDSIEDALRRINQPADKMTYALFWYIKTNSKDEEIFNALSAGDTERAIELCEDEDMSSLMNRAAIEFGQYHYGLFVKDITTLIHNDNYRSQFVASVCGDNFDISEEELSHLLIDILLRDIPSIDWKRTFYEYGVSSEDDDYVCEKLAQQSIDEIDGLISNCTNIERSDGKARYESAVKLKNSAQLILQDVAYFVGDDSFLYQSCADKVARELLNCALDYYKKCKDTIYSATQSCYNLNKYTNSIAVSSTLKERTQDSLDQIKKRLDNLPPQTSFPLFARVNKIIGNYETKDETVENGLALLQECAPLIAEIKENLGKANKSYINLSTQVVNLALSDSIKDINTCFKELEQEKAKSNASSNSLLSEYGLSIYGLSIYGLSTKIYKLRGLMKETWRLFLNIDEFDLDPDFIENRYKPNKDIIAGYVKNFKIKTLFIHADVDMRTETDIFKECVTLSQLQDYISKYPSGKYLNEANGRIKALIEQDNNSWSIFFQKGDYEGYLAKYPKGLHASQARTEINKKKKLEDENYWAACLKSGDYKLYLEKYPSGIHANEANKSIEHQETVKTWLIVAAVFIAIFLGIACIWGA